ncbi:guanylate-binding protein 1-like [Chanos chanos]|uniref:Guanylate-binding protein 1-like n=1 Tax=Chanos chanos TaxID=29144 RepID=A0A6J2W9X2_CHACN|nr:guanylate-binding protein 1-like [Chanos chanos]
MPKPVCLIESDESGCMCVRREALKILEQITQPVVVVAVVGLYRTGKSFLMNRLAGKHTGFALGATIESKTKGIWMWCLPHPTKEGHTLVLLDTEGLGDIDKGDEKHDTWIFCLAVLLSSTLVYNSMGTINNDALEKLHYVTELTEHIKVKSGPANYDQSSEFMAIFPSFVWAVRDFTLTLELEGRPITADQYLDSALKLKTGSSRKIEEYNQPRRCLREFFSERKCFVFERPTSVEKMKKMEQLTDTDLEANFVKQTQDFCSYIFTNARAKTIREGLGLTGRMLSHFMETYVNIIASGGVPCLENAVVAMAQIENQAAVQDGFHLYESGMEQVKNNFPLELNEIFSQHQHLNTMAIQVFMKRSFKHDGVHLKALAEAIDKHYVGLLLQNEEASEGKCQKLLMDLYAPMAKKLQDGCYAQPGGYELYCGDQYRNHSKKGVRAEDVLEQFMNERSAESKSILQADHKLTENERNMQEEKERATMLEQRIKAEQEKQEEMKKTLEEERQSQKERLKQMEEKIEEEKRQQQREMELAMDSKLKEQKDLLENGFKEKAELLGEEIQQLKIEKSASSGGIFKDYVMPIIGTGVDVLSSILQYKVMAKAFRR